LVRRASDATPPAAFNDPRNPSWAGTRAVRPYALLPASPLAPAAVGQSDLRPSYYRVSMFSPETFFANDEIENPVNLLVGRFDLAFVTIVLLPLVIIAMTYNVLSAEREDGRLVMLLSQPLSRGTLVLGKLATRGCAVLVMSLVVTVACLLGAGATLGSSVGIAATLLWLGVVTAYAAVWFAAGLLVDSWRRSSAWNAVALLAVWLTVVVLVPSLFNLLVTVRDPVPSRIALVQATREASNAASARGSQLLAMYYQDHPELMPGGVALSDFGTRTIAVQRDVDRAVKPLLRQFDEQLDRQQTLIARWRFVSPALAAYETFTDIAGTGTARHRRFERQVGAFVDTLAAFFTPRITRGHPFTTADLAAVPSFAFREESWRAVASRTGVTVLELLAMAGLLAVLAVVIARAR
jgi:ABC-2 type transport system permease protein